MEGKHLYLSPSDDEDSDDEFRQGRQYNEYILGDDPRRGGT